MKIISCLLFMVIAITSSFGSDPLAGYTYFPGFDSQSGDIAFLPGRTVDQLKIYCDRDPSCISFNTDGYIRRAPLLPLSQWNQWTGGFYAKVAIPGYTFYSGLDSQSGDLTRLDGKSLQDIMTYCNNEPRCASFNSDGYVRGSGAMLPLNKWNKWGGGFFAKDTAPGYTFYPGLDSQSGDIQQNTAFTLQQFRAYCDPEPRCASFNSDGYIRGGAIKPVSAWNKWPGGFFYKGGLPGYAYYKGLDSQSGDIAFLPGKTLKELKDYCDSQPNCVSFNTDGYVRGNALLPNYLWNKWNGGFFAKIDARLNPNANATAPLVPPTPTPPTPVSS